MRPVLAIVGRPNVGKSTLFNRLTRSRDALVVDVPGMTRDRIVGSGRQGDRSFVAVDTGGLIEGAEGLSALVSRQSVKAAEEADAVLFVVDGREGLVASDEHIAAALRPLGRPVQVVVNKCEGLEPTLACAEFCALGLGNPIAVSAAHGERIGVLLDAVLGPFGDESEAVEQGVGTRIALVGRPNVGKSTLVNRILGEERVVVHDIPGTTRDSVAIPFERHGRPYLLVDTAGMRRRARITERTESLSVIKTLQAIERCQVAVVLMDAREGITEQDLALLGLVVESGRGLVIAVNKWDGLTEEQRAYVKKEVDRRLAFLEFARLHYISALHGSGVGTLFPSIDAARASAYIEVAPAALTRIVEEAVAAHPPPLVGGRRIKLRYAHLGGHNPPKVLIHGSRGGLVPDSYRRYLERALREALKLEGTPIRIEFRQGENPFAGRKNPLTRRQLLKRKRLYRR